MRPKVRAFFQLTIQASLLELLELKWTLDKTAHFFGGIKNILLEEVKS